MSIIPSAPQAPSKRRVVAIDGRLGSGKSTTTTELARICGFLPINTGYLYRAITRECLKYEVKKDDVQGIVFVAEGLIPFMKICSGKLFVHGEEMNDAILKTPMINAFIPNVSKIPAVRAAIRPLQRAQAADDVVAVLEGRDIGTVVFPDAALKFWLECNPDEVVRRELARRGLSENHYDAVAAEIQKRDREDAGHGDGRMVKAEDAIPIDTTGRKVSDIVVEMIRHCVERNLLRESPVAAVA